LAATAVVRGNGGLETYYRGEKMKQTYTNDDILVIECHGVSVEDIGKLVDTVQDRFYEIRIRRLLFVPLANPAAFEYTMVLIGLSIIASGFLSELGKDMYRGSRTFLISILEKLRPATEQSGYQALGFRIDLPDTQVLFFFKHPPSEEMLVMALQQLQELLSGGGVESVPNGVLAQAEYDETKGVWGEIKILRDIFPAVAINSALPHRWEVGGGSKTRD
jgi:hypothetical protein